MTDKDRISALEERLTRMEEMLARALGQKAKKNGPPKEAPVKEPVRHTHKEEMDNLRKAMELGRLARTAPPEVFRREQKKFWAEGGWTPPPGLIDAVRGN